MITLTCGVNQLPIVNNVDKVAGLTVGDIRRKYRDQLNIPAGSRAILDGKQVDDNAVVKDGTELEFVKETGEKGTFRVTLRLVG